MHQAFLPDMNPALNVRGAAGTGTAIISPDTATGTPTATPAAITKTLKEVLGAWNGRSNPWRLIPLT